MKLTGAIVLLTTLGLLTGCHFTDKSGTTHQFVIGFGVVSVPSTNVSVARVYKTHVLGVGFSDAPGVRFSAGYASSTAVQIFTNQNLLIEVSDLPGRPLKVTVPSTTP